ncbi:MAG: hypothetical protein MHMPM18_004349 [Marteilia pararefringens]
MKCNSNETDAITAIVSASVMLLEIAVLILLAISKGMKNGDELFIVLCALAASVLYGSAIVLISTCLMCQKRKPLANSSQGHCIMNWWLNVSIIILGILLVLSIAQFALLAKRSKEDGDGEDVPLLFSSTIISSLDFIAILYLLASFIKERRRDDTKDPLDPQTSEI